jgi:hypothetical protein
MAMIPLRGYVSIPDGEYEMVITDADYDNDFQIVKIKLLAATGEAHTEQFKFLRRDGTENAGAMVAFTIFAKHLLGIDDEDVEEVDPESFIGKYIRATIETNEVPSEKTGKMMKFPHITEFEVIDGFSYPPVPKVKEILDRLGLSKSSIAEEVDEDLLSLL